MNKNEQIAKMHAIITQNPYGEWSRAQDLYEAGYGNIEQALTEFVDFLKSKTRTKKMANTKESWYNAFILNEHLQEFLDSLKSESE